jgi:rod shape-determining protein MreD
LARLSASARRPLSLWRRLDLAARWLFPSVTLLAGLLALGLPFGLPGQASLRPALAVGCVFFWSIYRPASLPAALTGVIGLVLDLLDYTPPGLWAVLLLCLQWLTIALRHQLVGMKFRLIWAVFAGFALGAMTLAWAGQSLLCATLLPIWPSALAAGAAIALYPALAAGLIRAHRGAAAVELA